MQRQPTSPDPNLIRLLDERDHLSIQLSIANDAQAKNPGEIVGLQEKLRELEKKIRKHRPARP